MNGKRQIGIDKQLMIAVILLSLAFTLASTGFNVYWDYKQELKKTTSRAQLGRAKLFAKPNGEPVGGRSPAPRIASTRHDDLALY